MQCGEGHGVGCSVGSSMECGVGASERLTSCSVPYPSTILCTMTSDDIIM